MTTTTTLTEQVPVLAAWYDDGECWTFDVGARVLDRFPLMSGLRCGRCGAHRGDH